MTTQETTNTDMTTVGCWEGRHGTTERVWGHGIDWALRNCPGTAASIDGYEYECPCECHGPWSPITERRPWLASLKDLA